MSETYPEHVRQHAEWVRWLQIGSAAGCLTSEDWCAAFYRHNGKGSYRGYPEGCNFSNPLVFLRYWSGPNADLIAKDLWALVEKRLNQEEPPA